jgi:hypothetical protein
MVDIEIPLGKRKLNYRLFEMLPAFLSYGAFILLIILSLISPILAVVYLLLIIITLLVKAVGIAAQTIHGSNRLVAAQKVDWHSRLEDLENPKASFKVMQHHNRTKAFGAITHIDNLRLIAADPADFPRPSQIYNAVIIAAYNESYEVISPTIESVIKNSYDTKRIILTIAYEQRGGEEVKETVKRLKKEYGSNFYAFHLVEHPKDIPNEVKGKGGNITYAGRFLQKWLIEKGIASKNVLVTTLDSDNKPYHTYFDYVTYEYIVHENRKHLAYQPISLFTGNIWDVPAPMRVCHGPSNFQPPPC